VPYTPNFVLRPLWEILTYAMCTPWHSCRSKCSEGIFTGLKHREFCATFVLFCAVYTELCAMLVVADSDIMPCVHCCILVGLSVPKQFSSIWITVNFVLILCCFMPHTANFVHRGILVDLGVPKEFSRVWSTANFVLLLWYFVPHTPNFVPCSLWQILTLCHMYTVAFLWGWVFSRNFQVSESLWILCYFLCCFVPHTPNFVPRPLWEILTYVICTPWHSGGSNCFHRIFKGLKHREFCATFVLFCAHTSNFVPCSLWQILALCRVYTVAFLWV